MKIRKMKHKEAFLTIVQGILLLAVLSAMFSVMVSLLMNNVSPAQSIDQGDAGFQQAVVQAAEEAEALEDVNLKAEAQLQAAREEIVAEMVKVAPLAPLAAAMYAALSVLFLIYACIFRGKWKFNLYRYGTGCLCFAACAAVFFALDTPQACCAAAILHMAALITDHIFSMIHNHRARNVVFRILLILIIGLTAFTRILGNGYWLFIVLFMTLPRIFCYIARIAFSRVKLDVLRRIVRKTYAAEILFGMVMLIVAFSIVLPQFEDGIPNFGDALWYCFAIVTTIGFGDFTAATLPGRIISVMLGLYGIIVVALITSIIVNFYNETKNSRDPEETDEESITEP